MPMPTSTGNVGARWAVSTNRSLYSHSLQYDLLLLRVQQDHHQGSWRSAKYLKYMAKEIELQASSLTAGATCCNCTLGGGTPTFRRTMKCVSSWAPYADPSIWFRNGEYPSRSTPESGLRDGRAVGELGFNRMSIGVQDFSRRATGRQPIQSFEETKLVLDSARQVGFKSISMDLIYGPPGQNVISFNRTPSRS